MKEMEFVKGREQKRRFFVQIKIGISQIWKVAHQNEENIVQVDGIFTGQLHR